MNSKNNNDACCFIIVLITVNVKFRKWKTKRSGKMFEHRLWGRNTTLQIITYSERMEATASS